MHEFHKRLLFLKPSDYKDEQEYRFVVALRNGQFTSATRAEVEISDFLDAIILGDRFSDVYKPTIESLCKDLDVQYKQLF